ncbi:SDR family NAD(P)-dependent oxidoreductase [Foetidibacter luteolus]|uniref:SDR family NAD(P)-dependent oxidoreductase n=1 Tax=Foetidibacter luteolus TaxID=2608880 RepID=UPI00129AA918|nr:SDR family NAD(P)-dependent oxidoreductase [Foetidibacter luteolus]
MSKIFITGSSDGLGLLAAKELLAASHEVVLHARNESRAEQVRSLLPARTTVLTGDLSSIGETLVLAEKVNELGTFDAVIHNAGIGYREPARKETVDGLPEVFAVNSLAAYLLTSLINRPKRLVYLSSALHMQGDMDMTDLGWTKRSWNGFQAYADSKLHDLILSQAVARLWPNVLSNAVEPGWVATKMGGPGAPDDMAMGARTQVWLSVSRDRDAMVSGKYFYHQRPATFKAISKNPDIQERFLKACQDFSGVAFPGLV